jgi:putative ABC transport system permease protein
MTQASSGWTRWIEGTTQDLRFAIRLLAKDRSFTLVAVITLALGIGANTAMFSVVESVLLQPLPYRAPDRIVWIAENNVSAGNNLAMVFGRDLDEWRNRGTSFEALSVLFVGDATMRGEEPSQVRVACLSAPITSLFGVSPFSGRDFLPREFEHAPQAPGLRASTENRADTGNAVLSDRLFRRLGSDPGLLGKSVVIGDVPYIVVGVLPESFRLPVAPSLQLGAGPHTDVDVVVNTTVSRSYRGPGAVLGRLKPGVPIERASEELDLIRNAANEASPKDETSFGLRLQVISLLDHVVADTRRVLLVLWAAVGFVLLVACVNIVSLLLARSVARQHETAIRTALGAGRWRLMRHMVVENMVLASAGGLVGIILGYAILRILTYASRVDVPRFHDATLNGRVWLFSAAVCATSGFVLCVLPALGSSVNPGSALRAGGSTTLNSRRVRRWHSALVICELALALIPLTGAGLMLRSLSQVRAEGAVLRPSEVLAARIQSSNVQGITPADTLRDNDRLVSEIESLPGVRAAALWSVTFGYPARIAGLSQPDDDTVAMWFSVSPHYRDASGVRLLAGRWFTDRDRTAAAPVVVVSERFARRFSTGFAGFQSIIGRTTFGPFPRRGSPARDAPMTIIGVVSDFRAGRLGILQPDDTKALPQVFFPDVLRPRGGGELLVRAAANPLGLASSIRKIVHSRLGTRLMAVQTLDEQLSDAIASRSFNTTLIIAFAGVALVLAAVGVSGVLRYAVAQRTQEIGLRLALGARQADVLRMILSDAAVLVVMGLAIGLSGSAALSTLIGGLLYGVSPADPFAHATVALVVVAVALIAAYLPARKAMRVDPMTALRTE